MVTLKGERCNTERKTCKSKGHGKRQCTSYNVQNSEWPVGAEMWQGLEILEMHTLYRQLL